MLQNYKIVISYDGTDYHGWQRQPNSRTIQGLFEEALFKITQKKIPIAGAGRTDAGVHAKGQIANFKANINMKDDDLVRALNALIPDDVKVISLQKVQMNFHARKMALSKTYQYRILNSARISPFLVRYVLHCSYPLDVTKMEEAAALFIREADFTAFSSNRFLKPLRKVMRSEIHKAGNEIIYTVEANGFLRYMVRTIVGTILEVGKGKMPPGEIEDIFLKKKRSLAGPTAPAKGLCLIKVNY